MRPPPPADVPDSPAERHAISVCLLGTPGVAHGDAPTRPVLGDDLAVLLVLLLYGPVARSWLAAQLWPDTETRRAAANLRQRLLRLRKVHGELLSTQEAHVQWADGVRLDVHELPALLRAQPARPLAELALGFQFADNDELNERLQLQRAHIRQTWRDALRSEALAMEDRRDWQPALACTQRLLEIDAQDAQALEQRARLHYLRGDSAAAREALRLAVATLGPAALHPGLLRVQRWLDSAGAASPVAADVLLPRHLPLARPPRLVARETAWAALIHTLEAGHCAMLVADAGLGKSRLLGDFVAQRPHAVATGARPGDATQAYALLARLIVAWQASAPASALHAPASALDAPVACELAHLVPQRGQTPSPSFSTTRLAWAVRRLLEQPPGAGTVLAIDDLHFADPASLSLLLMLATERPQPPAQGPLWLLASRRADMPAALRSWLADQDLPAADTPAGSTRRNVVEIGLAPWDAAATAQALLSLEVPGLDAHTWAAALQRHTGGNPLFVLQTLGALIERQGGQALPAQPPAGQALPLDDALSALIGRRLDLLPALDQKLARVAAVAGAAFGVALAAAVMGCDALDLTAPWLRLERASLFRDDGFVHDLVREAVLGGVPGPIRRHLSGRIADALVARHHGDAALIAQHRRAAEQWHAAALAFAQAARAAGALSDRAGEAAHWQSALDGLARATAAGEIDGHTARGLRCDWLWRRVHALRKGGEPGAKTASCEELRALATTEHEQALAFEATATLAVDSQQGDAALAAARAGRALAQRCDAAALALACACLEARALGLLARFDECLAVVHESQALLTAQPLSSEIVQTRLDIIVALIVAGRSHEMLPLLDAALRDAETLNDWSLQHDVLVKLAWVHTNLDDLTGAHAAYQRAAALLDRIGSAHAFLTQGAAIGMVRTLKELGRYGEALALLQRVADALAGEPESAYGAIAQFEFALIYARLGQQARVKQHLQAPPANAHPATQAGWRTLRARLLPMPPEDAIALIDEAVSIVGPHGVGYYRAVSLRERGLLLRAPEEGMAAMQESLALAEATPDSTFMPNVLQGVCELAVRMGDPARGLDAALRLRERLLLRQPSTTNYPQACWRVSQVLGGCGRLDEARAAWALARDWLLHTALPHVPEAFRDSFQHRHPDNRVILAGPPAHWRQA